MKELIKITTGEKGEKLVSARELHEFLELKKRFSAWMDQYIKEDNDYGFIEGEDFNVYSEVQVQMEGEREVRRTFVDYAITLSMSKEISMLTGTEKGKQARKYFISCEKQLQQIQSDYLQIVNVIYGRIYSLDDAISYLNKIKSIDGSLNTDNLLGFLHQEKVLKDNQVTKVGLSRRCAIEINNELYISQKFLDKIINKFNKIESEEIKSISNHTTIEQLTMSLNK